MGNPTYIDDYLKLPRSRQYDIRRCLRADVGTHLETPYNFCEDSEVRVVGYQVVIDTMSDQCQVHGIKYPKRS